MCMYGACYEEDMVYPHIKNLTQFSEAVRKERFILPTMGGICSKVIQDLPR